VSRRAIQYKFRLYIAGDAQNSCRALANLDALCKTHLPNRHEIEVIDVFEEPGRALSDGVFMTPTLIKLAPTPVHRIVGTLADTRTLVETLGLGPLAT
jgi:circadian clock protein KaiB